MQQQYWTNARLITLNSAGVEPVVTLALLVSCRECRRNVAEVPQVPCQLFEEVVVAFILHCPVLDKGAKSRYMVGVGKSP